MSLDEHGNSTELPPRTPLKYRICFWLWMVSMVAFPMAGISFWIALLAPIALLLAYFLVLCIWLFFKWRVWRRCMKLMNSGNTEYAITTWEREIERKGETAVRLNLLASLYANNEHWEKALSTYNHALTLGKPDLVSQMNRLACLKHLGDELEALYGLGELSKEHPRVFVVQYNYCLWLAEEGEFEEAREQLLGVEALHEVDPVSQSRKHGPQRAELMEKLRHAVHGESVPHDEDG